DALPDLGVLARLLRDRRARAGRELVGAAVVARDDGALTVERATAPARGAAEAHHLARDVRADLGAEARAECANAGVDCGGDPSAERCEVRCRRDAPTLHDVEIPHGVDEHRLNRRLRGELARRVELALERLGALVGALGVRAYRGELLGRRAPNVREFARARLAHGGAAECDRFVDRRGHPGALFGRHHGRASLAARSARSIALRATSWASAGSTFGSAAGSAFGSTNAGSGGGGGGGGAVALSSSACASSAASVIGTIWRWTKSWSPPAAGPRPSERRDSSGVWTPPWTSLASASACAARSERRSASVDISIKSCRPSSRKRRSSSRSKRSMRPPSETESQCRTRVSELTIAPAERSPYIGGGTPAQRATSSLENRKLAITLSSIAPSV